MANNNETPGSKAGIVYGMTDPTKNWVKIGCIESQTIERLRQRWESLCVLIDGNLLVRRAVRVPDVYAAEKWMHHIFEPQRIRGEIFDIKPQQFSAAICALVHGKGQRDIADFIKEVRKEVLKQKHLDPSVEMAWDQLKLVVYEPVAEVSADQCVEPQPSPGEDEVFLGKRPSLSFADLGLKKGDVLRHSRNRSVTVTVFAIDEKLVNFEGDILHIGAATRIMQERAGKSLNVSSKIYWKFRGKSLWDMAKEVWNAGRVISYNNEDDSPDSSAGQDKDPKRRIRPPLSLAQLGLNQGDVLKHSRDESVTATVLDGGTRLVNFEGAPLDIHEATEIMQKRAGLVGGRDAYSHWKFKGRILRNIALDVYEKMGLPPSRHEIGSRSPSTSMDKASWPSLSFAQLGLNRGDVLNHLDDEAAMAVVLDPDSWLVNFREKTMDIREASEILKEGDGRSPYRHWKFRGRCLCDMAEDAYRDMGLPSSPAMHS